MWRASSWFQRTHPYPVRFHDREMALPVAPRINRTHNMLGKIGWRRCAKSNEDHTDGLGTMSGNDQSPEVEITRYDDALAGVRSDQNLGVRHTRVVLAYPLDVMATAS